MTATSRCHSDARSTVTRPGMPTSTTRPRGRTMLRAWASDSSLPTQSITTSAPPVRVPDASSDRDRRPHGPGQLVGVHHHVGPELLGEPALVRVLGADEQCPGAGQTAPARPPCTGPGCPHRGRPRCAGHRPRPPPRRARRTRWAPPSRRLRRTGRRARGCSWASCATSPPDGPTPAGVAAETDLQSRRQVAEGDAFAPTGAALGTRPAGRDDAPCHAARGRARSRPGCRCRPSVPTTSWPGTKGKLTTSSK